MQKMKKDQNGIPTLYKGRLYRSRLEARWAAFFDLMDWKYEYEPYDLSGWIPDFALKGINEILVEIKPFFSLQEFNNEITIIKKAIQDTTKENIETLLLCATVFKSWVGKDGTQIGFILVKEKNADSTHYGTFITMDAQLLKYQEYGKDIYGFISFDYELNQIDRINGLKCEYSFAFLDKFIEYEEILPLWYQAGNLVQWYKNK